MGIEIIAKENEPKVSVMLKAEDARQAHLKVGEIVATYYISKDAFPKLNEAKSDLPGKGVYDLYVVQNPEESIGLASGNDYARFIAENESQSSLIGRVSLYVGDLSNMNSVDKNADLSKRVFSHRINVFFDMLNEKDSIVERNKFYDFAQKYITK